MIFVNRERKLLVGLDVLSVYKYTTQINRTMILKSDVQRRRFSA